MCGLISHHRIFSKGHFPWTKAGTKSSFPKKWLHQDLKKMEWQETKFSDSVSFLKLDLNYIILCGEHHFKSSFHQFLLFASFRLCPRCSQSAFPKWTELNQARLELNYNIFWDRYKKRRKKLKKRITGLSFVSMHWWWTRGWRPHEKAGGGDQGFRREVAAAATSTRKAFDYRDKAFVTRQECAFFFFFFF